MPYPPWLRTGPEPSPQQRARRSFRARVFAAALSAFVQLPGLAFTFAQGWHSAHRTLVDPVQLVAVLLGFVASGMLLLRWRGPAVVVVAALATPAIALAPGPPLAVLAVAFAAARAVLGGKAAWTWISLACMAIVGIVLIAVPGLTGEGIRVLVATIVLCVVAGAVTGASARRERFRAATREEASKRRSAAEEERLRIARELHDVLAHSLSQISVQAGVGLHLFDDEPERARESLRAIRETSTTALEEVRGVLGVLRQDDESDAPLRPGPSLDDIPRLLDETRASGLNVRASGNVVDGTRPPDAASTPGSSVGSAVGSAAYRIVQESLTNVRRHAGTVDVSVQVTASPRGIELRIENGPGSTERSSARNAAQGSGISSTHGPSAADAQGGRGILGMRERAETLGGTLEAEHTADGGFRVTAWLPVRGERRTT
ncbi:sensor histidine kinase [Planctomonas sp. JC2975]|uniref:sensor histidine kinase n=1 Tax=Planctomonas sp. JC2975 TaxID=2729626 RepID=UPI00147608F5|nr:histidine kinase [Planctomonas sp. JC2975]NNC10756.1 sensor histidine kinase [Planctomonas sp. JC2975]